MYRKTYIEINIDNLCNNVSNIISTFNNYKYYIGVIKGNAYGHGEYIAKYITDNGINYLAVSTLEEAIRVRKYVTNNIPILCLIPIDLEYIDIIIKNNITICVNSISYFNKLNDLTLKEKVKFHLKLNTGMNRLGVSNKEDVNKIYQNTDNNNMLELEGIFTHLSTSGIYDKQYDYQINRFKYLTSDIDLSKVKIIHIGRSSTLDFHQKIDICNGIRIGIMLYGVSSVFPSYRGIKNKLRYLKYSYIRKKYSLSIPYKNSQIELKQALSLKSEVIDIQKVGKSSNVGYGVNCVGIDGYVATVSVGYQDGLLINYNNFYVYINEKKYKVIGTINMAMISVLVDEDVKIGDIVTIISDKDSYRLLAKSFNITPYALLTCLNKSLPRIYIKDNKVINVIGEIE